MGASGAESPRRETPLEMRNAESPKRETLRGRGSFKKMKYIFFTLAILVTLSGKVRAQDFRQGFVVRNSGDTVRGLVRYRTNKRSALLCTFKSTAKSPTENYSPDDIKAFGLLGYKYYETKVIDTGLGVRVFAEVIVKGELSLYKHLQKLYVERDSLIALEPPRQGNTINIRYIGLLNLLMADCKQELRGVTYDEYKIGNAVMGYNRCKKSSTVLVKENVKAFDLDGLILTGLDVGMNSLEGLGKFSYAKSISMPVGIGLRFRLPKFTDRLYTTAEIFFDRKVYQVYDESSSNSFLPLAMRPPDGVEPTVAEKYR